MKRLNLGLIIFLLLNSSAAFARGSVFLVDCNIQVAYQIDPCPAALTHCQVETGKLCLRSKNQNQNANNRVSDHDEGRVLNWTAAFNRCLNLANCSKCSVCPPRRK